MDDDKRRVTSAANMFDPLANAEAAMRRYRTAARQLAQWKNTVERLSVAATRTEIGHGTAEDYARVAMNYMPWIEYVEVERLGDFTVKVRPLDKRRHALPQAECDDLCAYLMKRAPVGVRMVVPGRPSYDRWAAYGFTKRLRGITPRLP